jgi:hypothetical protein
MTFVALTVLNWMGRHAEGQGLKAILVGNIVLQGGEVVLNGVEVALGMVPASVLPGESIRVVVVVLFALALRYPGRNASAAA